MNNLDINNITCSTAECTIVDDIAYCCTYFICFLYTIFTLYTLYTSVKFKTFVTAQIVAGQLVRPVSAITRCVVVTGCYFGRQFLTYELVFQYLLAFFAILNIIVSVARFNAFHHFTLPH